LPAGRRRVTGLRREEVAALAGLGDTWYGLFESGKGIHVSDRVLDSVGRALRLNYDERRYLSSLVAGEPPAMVDFGTDTVAPPVAQALAAISHAPAFVIGPRLDYLAVNGLMRALHRVPREPSIEHRNLMLRVFVNPESRSSYPVWEDTAQRAVSKFRRNYGMNVGNPSFEELIVRLRDESPAFRRLWEIHDVGTLHDQISEELRHPAIGAFCFRLQAFAVPDTHGQTLVLMLPRGAGDEAALGVLLAESRQAAGAQMR
jgi:hypothetical protein